MTDIIAVDGDVITINPKAMEVGQVYKFYFKNDKYGVYKRENGEIVLLAEF